MRKEIKIKVMGYRQALDYVYTYSDMPSYPKYAIVSIQEYSKGYGRGLQFIKGGNCVAALNIEFSDITPEMGLDIEKLMTKEDAKTIHDFVESLPEETQLLIIHCHAGVSRSAAVAAAIELSRGGDIKQYFESEIYLPNRYVYYNMLEAYGYKNRSQEEKQ